MAAAAFVGARCGLAPRARGRDELEVALRSADPLLSALFEANVVPFIVWHADGRVTEANDAFLHLVGFSRAEMRSGMLRWSEITPPEWAPVDEGIFDDLARSGRFSARAKEYVRRDGVRVPVLIGGAALQGRPDTGVAFALDISEQKRAEAALAFELDTKRVITDNASCALFMVDDTHRCTFMNPAATAMIGFTLEEIQDRRLHDVLHHHHPDGRPYPAEECPFIHAYRDRKPLIDHVDEFVRKNGERFPVSCKVSPLGAHGGMVIEIRDLTEQYRAERDREVLLESERAARGEAERASRMKDELVATISHELRTPLNAILGWAEMLRRSPGSPERQARGLEVIERNARQEAQIISDLLDVSRIARGKLRLDAAPVDLAATVEAAVESVRASAVSKEVTLTSAVEPVGRAVLGDACRLSQIVSNLVSNAIKFTPAGGRVDVGLHALEHAAELRVRDTGVGIAPDFLPSMFDRFRQADASVARRHGGLGLGLSIVKSLVELHGGTVRAESDGLGKGAEFVVELPLTAPEATDERPAEAGPPTLAGQCLQGIRVLVVDDEPDAREIAQHVLEACEAAVVTAGSAEEALAAAQATPPPDVVVSDISMPGVDGYQLMRKIRDLPDPVMRRVPAVALTAFARSEDRARALEAGFQMHLPKPLAPGELAAAVASLAARGRRVAWAAELG